MNWTMASPSSHLSLEDVVGRLSLRDVVNGVVTIGSTNTAALTAASDYDLLVVLAETPAPLRLGLTYIDHRLTDIIFATVDDINQILAAKKPDYIAEDWLFQIVQALRDGRIVYDRIGRLLHAQQKVRADAWLPLPDDKDKYWAWFKINYNVKQAKRMVSSDAWAYHKAVDLRLLYSIHELVVNYFHFREKHWRGDKEAVRYLVAHDTDYFALLEECLVERDRERKVALYERLAALTTAPVGGLWEDEVTAFQFRPGTEIKSSSIDETLTFWEHLIGD